MADFQLIAEFEEYIVEYGINMAGIFTFDRNEWPEGDEILAARSSLELIRDQLSPEHIDQLSKNDAKWKSNQKQFNQFFLVEHFRADMDKQLDGWIVDESGKTPKIPDSHWWWKPIKNA